MQAGTLVKPQGSEHVATVLRETKGMIIVSYTLPCGKRVEEAHFEKDLRVIGGHLTGLQ